MQSLYRLWWRRLGGWARVRSLTSCMNKLVSVEAGRDRMHIAKSFLMNMNFSIARANARMILECRRGHRLARPAPPAPQAAAREEGLVNKHITTGSVGLRLRCCYCYESG